MINIKRTHKSYYWFHLNKLLYLPPWPRQKTTRNSSVLVPISICVNKRNHPNLSNIFPPKSFTGSQQHIKNSITRIYNQQTKTMIGRRLYVWWIYGIQFHVSEIYRTLPYVFAQSRSAHIHKQQRRRDLITAYMHNI